MIIYLSFAYKGSFNIIAKIIGSIIFIKKKKNENANTNDTMINLLKK